MSRSHRNTPLLLIAAIALSTFTLASCAEKPIDFEFTGTVYDKDTNQPIEGAYAIATYKGVVASSAGVTSHCIKTKGMYTGKDGRFHFPVEKRDGYSPFEVVVIHVDYVNGYALPKPPEIRRKQNAETYSDRNAYMVKQDPKNPDYFGGADAYCLHAKSKEDVVASVEYYKIWKAQYERFGVRKEIIDDLNDSIIRLQTLDGRSPDEIRAYPRQPK